jgi:hypothetical protein
VSASPACPIVLLADASRRARKNKALRDAASGGTPPSVPPGRPPTRRSVCRPAHLYLRSHLHTTCCVISVDSIRAATVEMRHGDVNVSPAAWGGSLGGRRREGELEKGRRTRLLLGGPGETRGLSISRRVAPTRGSAGRSRPGVCDVGPTFGLRFGIAAALELDAADAAGGLDATRISVVPKRSSPSGKAASRARGERRPGEGGR